MYRAGGPATAGGLVSNSSSTICELQQWCLCGSVSRPRVKGPSLPSSAASACLIYADNGYRSLVEVWVDPYSTPHLPAEGYMPIMVCSLA